MHNAAVIEVQPVDPAEASAYLMHDQIGAQHDRWARVGDYLTQHPDSVAAHALNNPLSLSLARATYQDQDPSPLTDAARFPTVTALREHLIDRILIVAYPDDHQRAHAIRWLAWIAHHLGSDRDLAWWRIPSWVSRWQLRLVVGLAVGLAAGLAGSSARMVGLTQLILVITGIGRVNFIWVLEGAHQRQVLRRAGAVYQFRHAELQEHLAKIHCQRTGPPTDT